MAEGEVEAVRLRHLSHDRRRRHERDLYGDEVLVGLVGAGEE